MRDLRVMVLAVCVLVGGCGGSPTTPASSNPPSPAATPKLDATTADALRFRTSFGLRADLEFIATVAADPRAVMDFGVPLLPEEVRDIERRGEASDKIIPIVQRYVAGVPAEFGGLYIDQEHGGRVTVLFTDHIAEHAAALQARLAGGAIAIRQIRYPEAVLRALQDRISADSAWFKTIPASLQGVGVDTIANAVEVDISSANQTAGALIKARYGVEPDMINVISDGTGAALQPWGELHGRVVDVPPRVLRELIILTELQAGDGGVRCEIGGDMAIGPRDDGTFTIPCQAGAWIVRAARNAVDVVAEGQVTMPAGGIAEVVLRPVVP